MNEASSPTTMTTAAVRPDESRASGTQPSEVLAELKARYPATPFIALGQTALWDEPTKAALRRSLDVHWPDARLIAATHDTDYFAKLPGHAPAREHGKYALLQHDDARTRGLWSAAGEMSRLFGSEDLPTRDALAAKASVFFYRALYGAEDPAFLLSELTAAWGWTGIIYTHWDRKISRDVPLTDILLALRDQIDWAVEGSASCLSGARAESARAVGAQLREWVDSFARSRPEASLTDLYRDLTPRLYALLLGAPAANLSTGCTSELLKLNTETAALPRFAIVDMFLNPITRRIALDAYNLAVGGSDIYTLDRFAPGAIPFDLVIPGRGRGTICIPGDGTITVDTPIPITLCDTGCDFSSVGKLAALVERELGQDCTLVGKAVTLLPMLAAEYLIVFHESASAYSDRTRAMMAHFRKRGIAAPDLRPILRMRYNAWDALAAAPAVTGDAPPSGESSDDRFVLPEFLAQAFGGETIAIEEFASCWRCAVNHENERLTRLSELRSTRELLAYLVREEPSNDWAAVAKAYDAATMHMLHLRGQASAIQGRVYTLYDQIRADVAAAGQLERAKGDDFRARVQPLRDRLTVARSAEEVARLQSEIDALQAERALRFDAEIASRRGQVRYARTYVRDLKAKRLELERGEEATAAREELARLGARAELARGRMARNALQTVQGLPHTNFRPTAWWLPLVDPSGKWFARLADTAEYYLEPLNPE